MVTLQILLWFMWMNLTAILTKINHNLPASGTWLPGLVCVKVKFLPTEVWKWGPIFLYQISQRGTGSWRHGVFSSGKAVATRAPPHGGSLFWNWNSFSKFTQIADNCPTWVASLHFLLSRLLLTCLIFGSLISWPDERNRTARAMGFPLWHRRLRVFTRSTNYKVQSANWLQEWDSQL